MVWIGRSYHYAQYDVVFDLGCSQVRYVYDFLVYVSLLSRFSLWRWKFSEWFRADGRLDLDYWYHSYFLHGEEGKVVDSIIAEAKETRDGRPRIKVGPKCSKSERAWMGGKPQVDLDWLLDHVFRYGSFGYHPIRHYEWVHTCVLAFVKILQTFQNSEDFVKTWWFRESVLGQIYRSTNFDK